MTQLSASRSSPAGQRHLSHKQCPCCRCKWLAPQSVCPLLQVQVVDPSIGPSMAHVAILPQHHVQNLPQCRQLHSCSGLPTLCRSLQVFDLQEFRPGQVLQQIYKNFQDAERRGDPLAASLKRSAFVAGGHTSRPLPSKTQPGLHQSVNSGVRSAVVHHALSCQLQHTTLWFRKEAHTRGLAVMH